MLSRVKFACVNEIEAKYVMKGRKGLARFKLYVYARRYIHCLYFVFARQVCARGRLNCATVEISPNG